MISLTHLLVVLTVLSAQSVLSREKVHLDVYYESQCPDCYRFFVDQLRPVSKELYRYMETNLVPYGNAKTHREGDNVTFKCQHGESECLLNKIHACALAQVKGTNLKRVLLASCLFDHYKTPKIAGKLCSPKYGLKWTEVLSCATNDEGVQLEDKYGNETNSLVPPHTFVPTIGVNKYRGDTDYQNKVAAHLKDVVCTTLAQKKIHPEECSK